MSLWWSPFMEAEPSAQAASTEGGADASSRPKKLPRWPSLQSCGQHVTSLSHSWSAPCRRAVRLTDVSRQRVLDLPAMGLEHSTGEREERARGEDRGRLAVPGWSPLTGTEEEEGAFSSCVRWVAASGADAQSPGSAGPRGLNPSRPRRGGRRWPSSERPEGG